MFDEYMHYLVEILHFEDVTKYLLKNVTLDVLPNLDSNSNGFSDGNCFDLCETTNLHSLPDISGLWNLKNIYEKNKSFRSDI